MVFTSETRLYEDTMVGVQILVLGIVLYQVSCGVVHVDVIEGKDNEGCGSSERPCKTLSMAYRTTPNNGKISLNGSTSISKAIRPSKSVHIFGTAGAVIMKNPKARRTEFAFEATKPLSLIITAVTFKNIGVATTNNELKMNLTNCRVIGYARKRGSVIKINTKKSFHLMISHSSFKDTETVIYRKKPKGRKRPAESFITIHNSIFERTRKLDVPKVTKLELFNCSFSNLKFEYRPGVVLNIYEFKKVILHSCNFTNNQGNLGGVVSAERGETFTIKKCDFYGNLARAMGGSLRFKSVKRLEIEESTFKRCKANLGGVISAERGESISITKCNFFDNSAKIIGGSLRLDKMKKMELIDNVFNRSIASNKEVKNRRKRRRSRRRKNKGNPKSNGVGGSVFARQGSSLAILNCTMEGSNARKVGGAIYMDQVKIVDVRYSNFLNGTSEEEHGGSMYAKLVDNLSITDCQFTSNEARRLKFSEGNKVQGRGGSIFISETRSSAIQKCTFDQNKSYKGGAIRVEAKNQRQRRSVMIERSTFTMNEADSGGSLSVEEMSTVVVSHCEFHENSADSFGGSLNFKNVPDFNVTNCNFTGNKADTGGAISVVTYEPNQYTRGVPTSYLSNCWFYNSQAMKEAGSVFIQGVDRIGLAVRDQRLYISGCYFVNGSSGTSGGAISVKSFGRIRLALNHCRFTNNTAFAGGGIYYIANTDDTGVPRTLILNNSHFSDNIGSNNGHAIYSFGNTYLRNITVEKRESTGVNNIYLEGSKISFGLLHVRLVSSGTIQSNMEYKAITVSSDSIATFDELDFSCPINFNIAVESTTERNSALFVSKCLSCSPKKYTISNNQLNFSSLSNIPEIKSECLSCPPGASCNGDIKAINTYWGYKTSPKNLLFVPCPHGHCCSSISSSPCETYNTCKRGRDGILCGSCASGYVLTFRGDGCVRDDGLKCNMEHFFVYFVLVAVAHSAVFTFLPWCYWKIGEDICRRKHCKSSEAKIYESSSDDVIQMDAMGISPATNDDEEEQAKGSLLRKREKKGSEKSMEDEGGTVVTEDDESNEAMDTADNEEKFSFTAFITIVILFYQLSSLVHVTNTSTRMTQNDKFIWTLFQFANLRFALFQKVCLTKELTVLEKEVIIIGFKLGSFCILILLLFLSTIIKWCWIKLESKQSMKGDDQLAVTSKEIESLAVASKEDDPLAVTPKEDDSLAVPLKEEDSSAITPASQRFGFVGVVKIALLNILKFNYTPMCVVCLELVHCIIVYGEPRLYIYGEQKCYAWWQYTVSCFIIPMIVLFPLSWGWSIDLLEEGEISSGAFLSSIILPPAAFIVRLKKQLLGLRKKDRSAADQKILDSEASVFKPGGRHLYRWSVIQLYRNLLIASIKIFILNPLFRCIIFIAMFLAFVAHDWYRMPYRHRHLNHLQRLSSSLLIVMTVCNTPASISFMGNMMSVPHMGGVMEALKTMEVCLLVLLPASMVGWKVWGMYVRCFSRVKKD